MTDWVQIYGSIWAALLTTSILMVNWIDKKYHYLFDNFVDEIRSHNASLGLDRSVDEKEIALDFLLFYREDNIEQYMEQNDFSKRDYIDKFNNEIGKPLGLIAYSITFGITLLYGFSGPMVYKITGLSFAEEYLVGFLILILIPIAGHFLL